MANLAPDNLFWGIIFVAVSTLETVFPRIFAGLRTMSFLVALPAERSLAYGVIRYFRFDSEKNTHIRD